MKYGTLWNVLRVLVVVTLGFRLFFANIIETVSARRALFDLTRDQVEVTTEVAREELRRIQDTEYEVLNVNGYGIPTLVILALLPYARRNRNEPTTTP